MHFDQDTIRELAVYAVQQFVSNQVPLDESIAEKARSLRLNEDQVRRVVESTNVIAFLKLREGAEDKTFEFQVASFPGVMEALLGSGTSRGYVDVAGPENVIEKTAFEVRAEVPQEQAYQVLSKSLYHIRGELEKVAQDIYNCTFDLERLVPTLVKQANWQERLETVTTPEEFSRIMNAFGKSGFEKSASLQDLVFVGKELEVATRVVELIKSAGEFSQKRTELEALEKKAASVVGKLMEGAARTAKNAVLHPLRAVTATAVAIPTAAIGVAGRGIKNVGTSVNKTKFGLTGVGGLALASATYEPKMNPRTGRVDDVWKNIYN